MPDTPDYGPIIADLERKRAELDASIAMLRLMAGLGTSETVAAAPASSGSRPEAEGMRRDQFFGMKAPDAIKAYLTLVKQPRTAARITTDLLNHGFNTSSQFPANTMRTTLKRMEDGGEVVQVKKEWGLTSWYPGIRAKQAKRAAADAMADDEDDDEG